MSEEVIGTRTGGQAAAQRAQEEKNERDKRRASSFRPYGFLALAAAPEGEVFGESIIARLVTDEPDWHEVLQHGFIPTKPAPKDKPSDKKWPAHFGSVCRYTIVPKKTARGVVETRWFDDCFTCDRVWIPGKNGKPDYHPKPQPRLWAWAVEREEVLGTREMFDAGEIEEYQIGDVVSYQDKMIDYTDPVTQETKQIQRWLILNFGNSNFFDKLLGSFNVYKTVLDRDYKITRKFSGTDTDYDIVPLDPVTEQVNGKTVKYDLRRPEIKALYTPPVTLFSLIEEQVNDAHYDWWFNTDVESSWVERYGAPKDKSEGGDEGNSSASGLVAAANDGADEEKQRETMEAIRARMQASKNKATVSA